MTERLQKELNSVQAASQDTSPQFILDSLLEETQVQYNICSIYYRKLC